jgi:hypothetical protein
MDRHTLKVERMKEPTRKKFEGLRIDDSLIVVDSTRSRNPSTPSSIAVGVRCRMSLLGSTRNQRLAGKEGVVVGNSRLNSSVRVLFDGRRTPVSLHRDYIEPITPDSE